LLARTLRVSIVAMLLELPRTGTIRSFADARRDARATPEALEALDSFERLLGEDWDGWIAGRQLANRFFVTLQHCPTVEGVLLARQVDDLTTHVESRLLRSIVRRLLGSTEWSDYVAGSTALSFMARAMRAGHSVRPMAEGNLPSPDVELLLHLRPVTVEFKAMHATAEARAFDDFLQAISDAGIDLNSLAGHLPEVPPRHSHAQIASQLVRAFTDQDATQVSIGNGCLRRQVDGRGLIFGPEGKGDRARLIDRIRERKYTEQLATVDGPTVLLVRSRTAFFRTPPSVIRHWIAALSDLLSHIPEVGALLVFEEGDGPITYQVSGNVRFLIGLDPDDRVPRVALLVSNDRALWPLTAEELDALASPSMIW
jgi:hypothetical protein